MIRERQLHTQRTRSAAKARHEKREARAVEVLATGGAVDHDSTDEDDSDGDSTMVDIDEDESGDFNRTSDSSASLGVRDAENPEFAREMQARGDANLGGSLAHGSADIQDDGHKNGHENAEDGADGTDVETGENSSSPGKAEERERQRITKRTGHRRHRGPMQWKPARNAVFAWDQSKIGLRKITGKVRGSLDGRRPGVETETGR